MRADYACGAALRRRAYGIPGVAQHLGYVAELSCVLITNTFNEIQMLSLSLTVSSLALALAVLRLLVLLVVARDSWGVANQSAWHWPLATDSGHSITNSGIVLVFSCICLFHCHYSCSNRL